MSLACARTKYIENDISFKSRAFLCQGIERNTVVSYSQWGNKDWNVVYSTLKLLCVRDVSCIEIINQLLSHKSRSFLCNCGDCCGKTFFIFENSNVTIVRAAFWLDILCRKENLSKYSYTDMFDLISVARS